MKRIVLAVLGVHALMLFLVFGGLSALGIASVLVLPIIGISSHLAYQAGKDCRDNQRRIKPGDKPLSLLPNLFRG